jgi:hypothetical protein
LPQSYTAHCTSKNAKDTDETNSSKQLTGRGKPQIKTDENILSQQHGIPLAKQKPQMKTVKILKTAIWKNSGTAA